MDAIKSNSLNFKTILFVLICLLIIMITNCQRFSKLPGGIFEIHPSELPEEVIEFTEHSINDMDFSPSYLKVGRILRAGSQVVAGTNFYLTFELILTTCLKIDKNDRCLDSNVSWSLKLSR